MDNLLIYKKLSISFLLTPAGSQTLEISLIRLISFFMANTRQNLFFSYFCEAKP